MYAANSDADGNVSQGEKAFKLGLRDPEAVRAYHLKWNRGIAADYHFASGYKAAAKAANMPYDDVLQALRLVYR